MLFKKLCIGFVVLFVFLNLSLSYERQELKFRYIEVKKGDTFLKLFGDKWEIVSRINKIDEFHLLPGTVLKVPLDWESAQEYPFFPKTLEQEIGTPKLILISLEEQFLAGYEYGKLKFWYSISSGMENYRTPCGRFEVNKKDANYWSRKYKQPMPYTLMFTKWGHAIHHGALRGRPSSHGCVRLLLVDAKSLYSWATKGTVVLVVDSFKELK